MARLTLPNGWDRFAVEQLRGEGLGSIWKFLVFLTGFLPLIFVTTGSKMTRPFWATYRLVGLGLMRWTCSPMKESTL